MMPSRWFAGLVRRVLFVVGVVILLPLAYLIPKRPNLVLFVGQAHGRFADNVKYLFLYVNANVPKSVIPMYVVDGRKHPDVLSKLQRYGYMAIDSSSVVGVWHLLRARVAIFDHNHWTGTIQLFALARAKKIQLWHGSGVKYIQRMRNRKVSAGFGNLRKRVVDLLEQYDLVLMNSTEQLKQRKSAFLTKSFYVGTHPRADILFGSSDPGETVGGDEAVLSQVRRLRNEGLRTILHAPTFRRHIPTAESVVDSEVLVRWLDENEEVVWVHKSHPSNPDQGLGLCHPRVFNYDPIGDVNPLFRDVDLLITDYSSIFADFLLLDRPILFFMYDLEQYLRNERALLGGFVESLPGRRIFTLPELLDAVGDYLLHGEDEVYKGVREVARQIYFAHSGAGNAERLWREIRGCCLVSMDSNTEVVGR